MDPEQGPDPATELPTVTISSVARAGAPILPGQALSHYRIVAKIGEGGMGAVYKATDTVLGRSVALKVISRAVVSEKDKLRFVREAKAASALNHPNIVTIYEFASENGIDFIAMEFVEGETLNRRLRQPPPLATLLDYARQVALALGKAHTAGITHRDLKPGNIMITPDGLAKVLDFGLAKHSGSPEGEDLTDSARLTNAGTTLGTPAYMSPEQAMGETADFRSDVFSFGIILYELACGRRPFRGEDEHNTLRQIIHKAPPPMDAVEPSLAPELQSLILECLEKDKARRPQSMAQVAARIQALIAPASSGTGLLPAPRPAGWQRWSRWAAGVAAAALLGTWLAPKILESPAFQASVFAPDSYQQYQKATSLLKKKYRKQAVDEAIQLLEQALEANPQHAASYAALSEAFLARYETAADPQWLTLALSNASKAVGLNPELAVAQVAFGASSVAQASLDDAEKALRRALDLDPKSATAHLGLGHVFGRRRQPDQAAKEFKTAIGLDPDNWAAPLALGNIYYQQQQFPEAIAAWQASPAGSFDNPTLYSNLGAAFSRMNRLEDSAASFQKALEIEPTAQNYSNLGTQRSLQGKFTESAEAFEKATQLNANNYLYWGNLGDAYRWAPGQRPKAPAAYRKAIDLARLQVGKGRDAPTRIVLFLAKSGDTSQAMRELGELPAGEFTANMHYRAAVAQELAGRRDAALASLQSALNGGFPSTEINGDPELLELRNDIRYHRLAVPASPNPK